MRKLVEDLARLIDEAVSLKKAGVFNLAKKACGSIDATLPHLRIVRAAVSDGIEGMPDLDPPSKREVLKTIDRNIAALTDASDQMSLIERSIKAGKWL